jgi:hypothetical protein
VAAAPAAIGNPEHTFDRTDGSADAGADRAADNAAHRTGGPVAFIGTFLGAADDALGMAGMGDCLQRQRERCAG